MANSNEKDLMGIGDHCAFAGCNQLDFLPFKCDCCSKTFCVEHRTYTSHSCPSAHSKESQVFVCPLCARAVKVAVGSSADAAFDRHCRTECDPANYDRVHRKKRCPAGGCRERLTTVNSYTCRDCGAEVCLKHRLPADHQCRGRAPVVAAAAQSRFAALPAAFKGLFSSGGDGWGGGGSTGSSPAKSKPLPRPHGIAASGPGSPARQDVGRGGRGGPAAGARGKVPSKDSNGNVAVQLRQYRLAQQAQQAQQGQAHGSQQERERAGGQGAGAAEVCQQCGACFASVQQLIQHAERDHMDGWSSGHVQGGGVIGGGGGGGRLERCPHCGRQFGDAVELVAHVTRDHAGSSSSSSSKRENCVLC